MSEIEIDCPRSIYLPTLAGATEKVQKKREREKERGKKSNKAEQKEEGEGLRQRVSERTRHPAKHNPLITQFSIFI